MRDGGLTQKLRKLYRSLPAKDAQVLESDLLSRYRARHPRNRRWLTMLNPWHRVMRFAVIGLAVGLLGVGACTTSTTTEVDMGKQLQLTLHTETDASKYDDEFELQEQIDPVLEWLSGWPGVNEVNVNVEQCLTEQGAQTKLNLLVWGEALDANQLTSDLHGAFPELVEAEIEVGDLNTTVTESWAQYFCRETMHLEFDGTNEEDLRAQILAQLEAQGINGDAHVEVIDDENGLRQVKITVTEEVEE